MLTLVALAGCADRTDDGKDDNNYAGGNHDGPSS